MNKGVVEHMGTGLTGIKSRSIKQITESPRKNSSNPGNSYHYSSPPHVQKMGVMGHSITARYTVGSPLHYIIHYIKLV